MSNSPNPHNAAGNSGEPSAYSDWLERHNNEIREYHTKFDKIVGSNMKLQEENNKLNYKMRYIIHSAHKYNNMYNLRIHQLTNEMNIYKNKCIEQEKTINELCRVSNNQLNSYLLSIDKLNKKIKDIKHDIISIYEGSSDDIFSKYINVNIHKGNIQNKDCDDIILDAIIMQELPISFPQVSSIDSDSLISTDTKSIPVSTHDLTKNINTKKRNISEITNDNAGIDSNNIHTNKKRRVDIKLLIEQKEWNYDTLNEVDIQSVCWRKGCNNKSSCSPIGRYKVIYCEEHKRNCSENPICRIWGCKKVAKFTACPSIAHYNDVPRRCKEHCKKPQYNRLIYNTCCRHGCKSVAKYSECGTIEFESFCVKHKNIYCKKIKLYCNHFKCNNIPTTGYKDEKYPLVCDDHLEGFYK
uniref:Uncharacterized protein n=1 Tax=Pithovirus LCPAC101 TaxID=2506586 RepID=A0A481Z2I4_9VIRU|nr:MAG: hypothetical protein LCPAC101_02600 [Pithovirus LCPAC101]